MELEGYDKLKERCIYFNFNVLTSESCSTCAVVEGDISQVKYNPFCAHCSRATFLKADHYCEI